MQQSYSGVAKAFHWAIVVLVFLMLYGGFTSDDLPKAERLGFFQTHAGLGILILILMLGRILWRRTHPAPALPEGMPRWQQIASIATHHGLYLLVLLQPIFGLMTTASSKFDLKAFGVLGLQVAPNETIHEIGETLHSINAWIITALIALHVVAALYHHFILRDNVLKRMLPFVKA